MAIDRELLREFEQMSKTDGGGDYLTAMGVVGLRKAIDEVQSSNPIQDNTNSPYTYNIYNSLGSMGDSQSDREFDVERSAETIVDKLRGEVFSVHIIDALNSIVRPLADRIKLISLEEQQVDLRNHTESLLYYREIVDSINRLGTEIEEGFVNRMIMEYRKFMRNPALSILKGINKGLIQPMTKVIGKILFGGRERTDTEKIVDAINQMSEFLQRGSIDRTKGLFERLREEGVVGTTISTIGGGVLGNLGMGRGTAQEAEMKRSRGEELSLRERFALSQYRGEIEQFGRQGGLIESSKPSEQVTTPPQVPLLEDILKVLEGSRNALERIEMFGYDQAGIDHQKYLDMQQDRMLQQRNQMTLSEHMAQVIEINSDQYKLDKKSFKTQKEQLDEAEETNRKLFMQTVMRALSTVTSTVGTLVGGIGGGLATLLGLKGLTKGKGGLFGNLLKNTKGGGMSKFLKRIPILGTLLAGGAAASIWSNDEISQDQKKTESFGLAGNLLGGLAGAKVGGAIGTAIGGPLGTLIGGVIGGIGGAILGEETMREFEGEITDAFNWWKEAYNENFFNPLKSLGSSILEGDFEGMKEAASKLISPVTDLRDKMIQKGVEVGNSIAEFLKPITDFKNKIINFSTEIGNSVGSFINKLNPFSSDDESDESESGESIIQSAVSWGKGLFGGEQVDTVSKPTTQVPASPVMTGMTRADRVRAAAERQSNPRIKRKLLKKAAEYDRIDSITRSDYVNQARQKTPVSSPIVTGDNASETVETPASNGGSNIAPVSSGSSRADRIRAAAERQSNPAIKRKMLLKAREYEARDSGRNQVQPTVTPSQENAVSVNTSNVDGNKVDERPVLLAQETNKLLKMLHSEMKKSAEAQKKQPNNSGGFDASPSSDTLSVMGG